MQQTIVLFFLYLLLLPGCLPKRLFLIPLRWHGPNNHITTIKETIALSGLLPGSKVAIPNLQEHKFSDHAAHNMLSTEIFDLRELRKNNVSYFLLDNLLERWDGRLDVILYFRDENFPRVKFMATELGLYPPLEHNWLRSPVSATRGCSPAQVEHLREMLEPHHYVGVVTYDDFTQDTHKLAGTLLTECGADMCCQAYKERSVFLRRSPRLMELAESVLGDRVRRGTPFIAGHIRPLPDDCVLLWQSPKENLDEQELSDACRTDFIYSRFVPNLQALQRMYNITTVFILTHPFIRHRVVSMLKAGGIDPVFIDMAHLNASIAASDEPLETPMSVSLLAMVEEAVAVAATAFLGTAESSMTGMIVQERLASGSPPETVYFMSPHPDCSVAPCKLTDYYASSGNDSLLYETHRRSLLSDLSRPQQQQRGDAVPRKLW